MLAAEMIPLEFEGFLAEVGQDPDHAPEMWQYALAMLLIDTDVERIIETREEGDRLYILVQTSTGTRHEVVRPAISEEFEQELLERVREIMSDRAQAAI